MRCTKTPDREAFAKARRLVVDVLRACEDASEEVADAAQRMREEVEAWTARYFHDDLMDVRREMRRTGSIQPAPEPGSEPEPAQAPV